MGVAETVSSPGDVPTPIEVRSYFVRNRNALAVRAEFSQLFVDYYLHLMDNELRNEPEADKMLKDALVGLTLHMASRPIQETHAWTMNFQEPLLNVFVTGSSLGQNVVGRVFDEGVREASVGVFHAEHTSQEGERRRSSVEITGTDVFRVIEGYYRQSEQRLARIFAYDEEDFVFVSAQPDCDEAWLESLDDDTIRSLDTDEELSLLEKREFRFECGCTLEKIYPALAPLIANGLDDLFLGDDSIKVTCPRCAARWRVTREQLEAVMGS